MVKRIIVIDTCATLYPIILKMKEIEISLMYVDGKKDKTKILNQYPDMNVCCTDSLTKWDKTFVSKDDINKFSYVQLKVERFAGRFLPNRPDMLSQYYHALAFWLYHLRDKDIDCVILGSSSEHGAPTDTLPIEIAKSLNIPVFLIANQYGFANGVNRYQSIKCCNTDKFINISSLLSGSDSEIRNVEDIIREPELCDDSHVLDPVITADRPEILKKLGIRAVNILTEIVILKKKILHKKICRRTEKTRIFAKLLYIYDVLISMGFFPAQKNALVNALSMMVPNPSTDIQSNKRKVKKLFKYYRRHSLKDIPKEQKCIVYLLHYEPETAIMNISTYNSQIYNIEMLSHCLPDGWKLYVKEHPTQFKAPGTDLTYYKQIPHYKSIYFYQRISKIKNVELLDDRIKSSNLLDSTKYPNICSFSSINGTIVLESIEAKRPILLFDIDSTLYKYIPGVFGIDDMDDLKKAIDIISAPEYIPSYGNYKAIIPQYLIKQTYSMGIDSKLCISPEALFKIIDNAADYMNGLR